LYLFYKYVNGCDAVEQYIKLFIQNLIDLDRSQETVAGYRNDLIAFQMFLTQLYNATPYVDEVQTEDIEQYMVHLKDKQYAAASRNRKLATLRSFFKYAVRRGWVKHNPALEIELLKKKTTEKGYLSEQQVQDLIESIQHPMIRLVIITLYYTGLRISECINLRVDHVDLDHGTIRVINGKGGKDRLIPMNKKLHELLLDYATHWRVQKGSDRFFCTLRSGGLNRNYVNKIIKKAIADLGWKKKVSPHTLRHSFASNLVKKDVHLVKIQKLLGHASLATTSVYTHTNLAELKDAVDHL